MTSFLHPVAAYIEANNLGTQATDLFVGMMVDLGQTGPVVGIAEYKGREVETMGSDGVDIPMMQVAVRAPSFDDARNRCADIRTLLRHVTNQSLSGMRFIRIAPDGVLKYMERDNQGRHMFTADFEVWLEGQ